MHLPQHALSPLGRATGLLLLASLARAGQQEKDKDTVQLKGDAVESGQIESEDWDGLAIKAKGGARTIPWSDVVDVSYADAPEELDSALSDAAGGRLAEAKQALERLAAESGLRPVIRQRVLFHLAWVEQRTGDAPAALDHYRALLQAFPKGHYLRASAEAVAFALAAKDLGGATTFLEQVAQAAKDAGPQAELALVRGLLLERQKKTAEARAQFEAAEKASGVPPAIGQEAKLGKARCLLQEGKGAEAEPIFRELTQAAAPAHVLAGAWNGLGDIYSEEGRAKRDIDRVLDGTYGYLRGVVQYKPVIGDSTIEHQRALAGAAQCFKYISELEQNTERKKLYADRSRVRLEELGKEYPASSFLPK